ncbi:L-cysteine desulfhydrase [Ziziphus jujuba]|uniref:L-cysteine desulfhydrase n=2 Tax=Ziziphus jujuba TaxID=326968 RepID=A0A6P4AC19_ZIZJJ|nr:L-cysteine desulfhydrase [Ziziphus jujuba]KAH7516912.1 hypothetical protein FEM48_Zijuj09G0005800 [Ziziphus jujuba var. spinosa]
MDRDGEDRRSDNDEDGTPTIKIKKPRLDVGHSHWIREEFAHHQLGIARINNGSFGSCPGSVLAAQRAWQLRFLRQPDDFYFKTLPDGILKSRTLIKDLINADHVDEVSLVDNATTAAAIVLQQIGRAFSQGSFCKNDVVVMFHCAFQAIKKSIQAYVVRSGGTVLEIQLPFPVHSRQQIISEFRRGLERAKANGGTVRLAIIDHITSMPSFVIPVRELVQICRDEGVDQVFVDAAHAMGTVPVDVKHLGVDLYVTNLHKWFFCPPSVAVFYCRKSALSSQVHHPVVTQEYGNGLPLESSWIGTRDYSSQLVVPSALEFVKRFEGGLEGIMKRNHDGVVQMGKMLADSWGTILGSPPNMCSSMIMVGLPSRLCINSDDDASRLRSHLRVHCGVEVPTYYHHASPGEGEEQLQDTSPRDKDGFITGYARISYQVYNTVEDYHKFRDAINQLVEDGKVCKFLSAE